MDSKIDFITLSSTTNYILAAGNIKPENCNFTELDPTNRLGSIIDLLGDPNCLRRTFNWTLFYIFLYSILFIFGLVVNGLVAFVVGLKRRLHTTENLFIANMAVADILGIGFCTPANLFSTIFIPWIPTGHMCKAVPFIQGLSRLTSAFSLIAVSLDRYRAIYYPWAHPGGLSKNSVLKISLFIWTFAAFLSLPYLFAFELVYLPEADALPQCQEIWDNPNFGKLYYVTIHLAHGFLVPLIVVTLCVFLITWKIVSGRLFPNFGSEDEMQPDPAFDDTERKKNCRFVFLLTALSITLFVCWFPFHAIVFKAKFPIYFDGNNPWEVIATPIAQLLVVLNSCLNPVIYNIFSTQFRQILESICRRRDPNCIDCIQEDYGVAWRRRVYECADDQINCEIFRLNPLDLQENLQHYQDISTLRYRQGRSCPVLGVSPAQALAQSETSSDIERIESIDV